MIPFAKYSGSGNDFILFDNRTLSLKFSPPEITRLCNRPQGIGADGIILLEPSKKADGKMRIFNKDGSEAEMCGNGIRCLARFFKTLGFAKTTFSIETFERILNITLEDPFVEVEMGEPTSLKWDSSIDDIPFPIDFLNTGVPHAVSFHDNLQEINVATLGKKIRFHPAFGPKGTNATFAKYDGNKILVRTFERGVEGETLACGTGVAAAAFAAKRRWGFSGPISVIPPSGEEIVISFDPLRMKAKADAIFHGQFPIESLKMNSL